MNRGQFVSRFSSLLGQNIYFTHYTFLVPNFIEAVEGLLAEDKSTGTRSENTKKISNSTVPSANHLSLDHYVALKTFRLLILDRCQQFNGAHPR